MKIARTPSMIALAIYLILIGLSGVFDIRWGVLSPFVPLMALVSGVLILIGK